MRAGLVLAMGAALLAGACNMGDRRDERETASRERIDRKERERERERREREREEAPAEGAQLKLDQVEPGSRMQPASSAAPESGAVTRSWFAGRWTDTDECKDAGTFLPNGTFLLADGTRGMWNIRGGRLVLQGTGGRSDLQLKRVDDNNIEVIGGDGSVGRSTRC